MSLSSTELNYMLWRYLQESGYELSAYAFDKESRLLKFEDNHRSEVIQKIEPGFLINLVQKGILYSLAEEELRDVKSRSEILTLFGSLLKEEKDIAAIELNGHSHQNGVKQEPTQSTPKTDFTTKQIVPLLQYDESLMTKWHPSINVVAYIKNDSNLLISAITDDKISETASLRGPGLDNGNDLTVVSWSPLGNLITTANTRGELCSWSPDGHLRNITSVTTDDNSASVLEINWSTNGQHFLTQDFNGKVSLWNGTDLSIIEEVTKSGLGFCWLSELKFAVSTKEGSIKLYSVGGDYFDAVKVSSLAVLGGTEDVSTSISFGKVAKKLASYSDTEGVIKLWLLGSNEPTVLKDSSRILPLVSIDWLDNTLITVSINGIIRIWSDDDCVSTNIFRDDNCYRFQDSNVNKTSGKLVYAAALSPDGKWLAIGDDKGRTSIWGTGDNRSAKCLAVFDQVTADGSQLDPEAGNGISDITWDHQSTLVSVSYKGAPSVIFKWGV